MAETVVEIARCETCGADVRKESLFCYNCGASVTPPPATETSALPADSETDPAPGTPETNPGRPVGDRYAPTPTANTHGIETARSGDSRLEKRPPLRSAASMRTQRRAFNRQPLQVSWEQPEGSPKAFVITTIVLAVGAAVLLVLAFYLQ